MSAAKFARDLLAMNGLPEHVIVKIESELQGYSASKSHNGALEGLLNTFITLHGIVGDSAAVEMFKNSLIK